MSAGSMLRLFSLPGLPWASGVDGDKVGSAVAKSELIWVSSAFCERMAFLAAGGAVRRSSGVSQVRNRRRRRERSPSESPVSTTPAELQVALDGSFSSAVLFRPHRVHCCPIAISSLTAD